jgi:hypothetical protein
MKFAAFSPRQFVWSGSVERALLPAAFDFISRARKLPGRILLLAHVEERRFSAASSLKEIRGL